MRMFKYCKSPQNKTDLTVTAPKDSVSMVLIMGTSFRWIDLYQARHASMYRSITPSAVIIAKHYYVG